ncbi:hypothetical protein BH09SUM1_BH09SUM1_04700 [soil metagenome]
MRALILANALAAVLLTATSLQAQPTPVAGTEMVPNEYGDSFPREITWGKDGARMVLVPYGKFTRGLDKDKGGSGQESPAKEIMLPSFYIDKYEVTNQQYMAFLKGNSASQPRTSMNPELSLPDHPVVAIPWNSANAYARWAGKELPTEAMWQKAARGPKGGIYSTGDTLAPGAVVGKGANGGTVPAAKDTGDVSGYGALHMNGNASEFISDWYGRDYYGAEGGTDNPTGPATGESKVVAGPNFLTPAAKARVTLRDGIDRTSIRDEVGFRGVWVPHPLAPSTPIPPTPIIRRTTVQDDLNKMIEMITPALQRGDPKLSKELNMQRAVAGAGTTQVQFVNFTPFQLGLSFLSPKDKSVYRYNEPVKGMTYRNVELPNDLDLYVLAYAEDAPEKGPKLIGLVRAESGATVVIKTEFFSKVMTKDNTEIGPVEKPEAQQYYEAFNPAWNEVEIYNPLTSPMVVHIDDIGSPGGEASPVGEYTLEPSMTLRISLPATKYRVRADYVGASEESSTPGETMIDNKVARRLFVISEDDSREGGVVVITKRRPYVKLDLIEAKGIQLTRAGDTPAENN